MHTSICILSYNRPQFLMRCLRSIFDTIEGEPVEIIIHDDGSSDREVYNVLQAAQQTGRVSTVILNPPGHNQGQGVALNRMFNMATGNPIIKCDQDMTFKPGWLQECERILQDPRVGLLGVFKYWHDPVDWRKTRRVAPTWHPGMWHEALRGPHDCGEECPWYDEPDDMPSNLEHGYSFHTHICGSVMVIPRVVWRELGPFAEHSDAFAEDAMMQRAVNDSGRWACALPDQDLAINHGFGIGPSTVVEEGMKVHKIHHGPVIFA